MKIQISIFTVLIMLFGASAASAKPVLVTEKTTFYSIAGQSASDFAMSMSRNGPYSRQHGRRAWATASHNMTFQLVRRQNKSRCRVRDARVKMKITYQMPKLRSLSGVSKRSRNKWRKMYRLLNKHERVHGKFYRQLAYKTRRELRKLKPAKTCWKLDRKAKKLVERLNAEDRARNNAFDARDRRNYRLMERLFSGS